MRVAVLWPAPSSPWPGGLTYFSHVVACLTRCKGVRVVVETASADSVEAMLQEVAISGNYSMHPVSGGRRGGGRLFGVAARRLRGHGGRSIKGADVVLAGVWESPGRGVPWVTWVPDFQHLHLPSGFSKEERDCREETFVRAMDSCRLILLSSEDARRDLASWMPAYASKARVAPFVSVLPETTFSRDPLRALRQYSLRRPLLVVSNQWWIHKNHLLVVRAGALAREQGRDWMWAFTGPMYDSRAVNHSSAVLQLIASTGMRDSVAVLGMLPRAQQLDLLRAASCVVQPSAFEGWSTIVEDCRTLGTPIALSDIAVHREQSPPLSHFFSLDCPDSLVTAVDAALKSERASDGDAALVEAMEARATVCGQRMLAVLREAAGAPGARK